MMVDTWLGDPETPLLGFLHLPDGGVARSGVVICPPFGFDQVQAYRAMRFVGQELAGRGIAALRFDYLGEGDSSGSTAASDAAEGWMASIRHAIQYLRDSGVQQVALLGLGSGSLVAAEAAATEDVASLVLWDPELSGRRFIRKQRSLYELAVGGTQDQADDSNALVAFSLHSTAMEWLKVRETTVASLTALGIETLVLGRSAYAANPALGRLAAAEVDSIHFRSIDGQEGLLEVPGELAVLPVDDIGALVDWLDQRAPAVASALTPVITPEAVVGTAPDGGDIVERLHRVGEHDLFAIETTSAAADDNLVVLQPGASEHRVGPSRFQVLAARELAGRGRRAVRFDRRITGDTTEVVPGEPTLMFAQEWVDDTHALLARFAPTGLAMVGLCAGGWVGARVAEQHPALLTVLMSPNYYKTTPLKPGHYSVLAAEAGKESRLRALKGAVKKHIPGWLWRVMSRLQLFHDPAVLLAAPSRPGSTVAVLLTPADAVNFAVRRGPEAVDRLTRRGADVRIINYSVGDHSLYGEQIRHEMMDDLLALVEETMPRAGSGAAATMTSATLA
ncbi:hypothetical protein QMG83_00945 [Salinibacterium sp. G-O1]|uniref:hypothetical protein n=1 Tax=Salinibacterium sp. G-O1 TaxID=3046208 RepID=UPI0024BA59B2|nr:hypothetical protein [Salinibacterium sp. G-O1]MDJ0333782.1 hypothetical protein [Salinibacterium sp. G-O1]